ncbi:hypothetical protein [Hymenobacter cellulosivorans]|uniref:Uncharacterized protein n=1 Tax=Hymenobacter cellulosivorans TaxID=2932249 RepID=A0ABY4FAM0_9BACT|nr:hypothetical protein [Hymenobacter cellulosivorans]UOQ53058.1 hypothetical protein MUN80_25390 [Hymenobacter cellulosivorans]
MELSITNVDNISKPEIIYFYASEALNLKDYLLYDATFSDEDHPSNKGRHVFRFPTHALKKGDRIALEIGEGPRKGEPATITVGGTKGVKTHVFYWDRKAPIINNTGDKLTLVKIADDHVFTVPAVKK